VKIDTAGTLRFLHQIAEENPALLDSPARDGYMRGIEFYSARAFLSSLTTALEHFTHFHDRLPDLVNPISTADHFFCVKFFGFIPMPPNPADKLNVLLFVPERMSACVTKPKVRWTSDQPVLPDDSALPPGQYYLKAANGCRMHELITWPVDKPTRRNLERKCAEWLDKRYGLRWGEWWYTASPQRIFIEDDVSGQTVSETTFKIFVRRGEVKMIRAIESRTRRERLYDGKLDHLAGYADGCIPTDWPLPNNIDAVMDAAAQIGRPFDIARIDFFHTADLPMLGEITLCHWNAAKTFLPASFDEDLRKSLFE
jgi:hypothetical protein